MPKNYFIGRENTSDIVINDPMNSVSRRHAELTITSEGKYYLTDCKSSNGTKVWRDDEWQSIIKGIDVEKDDTVMLGEHQIKISDLVSMIGQSDPEERTPLPPMRPLIPSNTKIEEKDNKSPHARPLKPGDKIGKYIVDRYLAAGGFGITYLATHPGLGAPHNKVVIKEYLPKGMAERGEDGKSVKLLEHQNFEISLKHFNDEATLLSSLNQHESIVNIHDYIPENGTAYMILQFIEGGDLQRELNQREQIELPELNYILFHLLNGLEKVHKAEGLCLHRDLKPENIMLRKDGFPVLIDFGAARCEFTKETKFAVPYTPGYAPIEQDPKHKVEERDHGPWTDIYSLSAIAYVALGGSYLPDSENRVEHDQVVPAVVAFEGQAEESFLKAIDWGLAVQPEDRPRSVAAFRSALGL